MKQSDISQIAQAGFASAAAYEAHRPSYPPQAVDQLLEALEIAGVEHAKVADLAAGTGKFTELLAARPEKYEIVAIEPHDGMRHQLQQKKLARVTVVNGTAENLSDLEDGSLAAVVAAQSFHWFANIDALKEIHRVLQPTGVFGMIWNIDDYNAPRSWHINEGWDSKLRDLTWKFDDNVSRFRHERWKQVFEDQNKSSPLTLHFPDPLFSLPLGESSIPFETFLSKDDLWSRYRTLSQVAMLEEDELEKVKKTVFEAVDVKGTQKNDEGK